MTEDSMLANPQLLYLGDPLTLEFQAEIRQVLSLPDGRLGVILDQSYFYPTGGGQEHDAGFLGDAHVIDVFKQDQPAVVVHVVDRPLVLGKVTGKIDADRRERHQQHHTAQHLLTQCFLRLFGLETLSANINGYTPSTLDLPTSQLLPEQLRQAEELANRFIFEDRQVKVYFVAPQELEHIQLRQTPKVSDNIRIVEIDGFDFTPCGGTHCTSTGQIGILKIVKIEKQKDRTRVHFVAGWQALELFQVSYEIMSSLATWMSVGQTELVATIQRQVELLQKTQKELQALHLERLSWEARQLADAAEAGDRYRIVLKIFKGRATGELRSLGIELARWPELVSILAGIEGEKLTLIVSCGESAGIGAKDLLVKLLAPFQGRGGGDAHLAQGGGSMVEPDRLEHVFRMVLAG